MWLLKENEAGKAIRSSIGSGRLKGEDAGGLTGLALQVKDLVLLSDVYHL